jgi:hypothetical protein
MSRALSTGAILGWLEHASDWLSPIVVKEVRQVVRGREFTYSFGASLVAGLAVAFIGTADALSGSVTSGGWTFFSLMMCLSFLGLAVVPLGAYGALRTERLEQTLDLITLTALSPRRVVTGKLLAQGVKLATLFAAMAPFIAMSFLLGGVDFVTILVALALLFMWSLWASAACLCLSTLFKSRAMSGLVLGGAGLVLFVLFGAGRVLFFIATRGAYMGPSVTFGSAAGSPPWWGLAIMASMWAASIVNLVLLAENRLSLATEDRVTPLRVGFFVQFVLVAAWTLSFIRQPSLVRAQTADVLNVVGAVHLAVVAMFTVTEDLVVPRRARLRMKRRRMLAMFRPGGGRGALYVLVQMVLLLTASWLLDPDWKNVRWLLAACAYICFFTGVPVMVFRALRPARAASFHLRVALLALLPAALILPDVVHYILWRPAVVNLNYAARHLVNPFRTLANWNLVEDRHWLLLPFGLGIAGLVAYLGLVELGARMTAEPAAEPHIPSVEAEAG